MKSDRKYAEPSRRVQRYAAPASRWRRRPFGNGASSSSKGLAGAIAARYAFAERRWPLLEYLFAHREASVASTTTVNQNVFAPVFLNARSLLQFLVGSQVSLARDAMRASSVRRDLNAPLPALTASSTSRTEDRSETEIVARIMKRIVREEMETTTTRRGVNQIAASSSEHIGLDKSASTGPVRTFLSKAPANDVRQSHFSKGQEEPHEPATSRRFATTIDAAKQHTLDIGRLTNQVIQAIDQRIVAHRERMGRN